MPTQRKRQHGPVILVLGGARSGKSAHAQALAEKLFRHPCYVATAEVQDGEMADRVRRHRRARGRRWGCIEEPLELAGVLRRPPRGCDGLLVDCLTLWLSNVMLQEGARAIPRRKRELIAALRQAPQPVLLVSNEVGLGIVPPHKLGRVFRDEAGWLNQAVAAAATQVVVVIAGLPLALKGTLPCAD